jgi:hypothetical protein
MTSIQPELWVDRGRAALAFYEAAFDARVLHRVGDRDDIVAQLAIGDAVFWIAATGSSTERLVPQAIGGATGRCCSWSTIPTRCSLKRSPLVPNASHLLTRARLAGGQTDRSVRP